MLFCTDYSNSSFVRTLQEHALSSLFVYSESMANHHISIIFIIVAVLIFNLKPTLSRIMSEPILVKLGSKSNAIDVVHAIGEGKYLAGKTAIVTGGNSGIGLETCKALAR